MRPPREEDFTSRLRDVAVTARVGTWLGVCFALAFVTGLVSHYAQLRQPPVPFPTSPAWGYRVTQGLHVVSGTAAVPLLLVKLWTVYPRLFRRPPRQVGRLLVDVAERASIGVLVAAAIFELATGLANASQWYPWSFSFRSTHYAVAWVAIGSLVLHVAVKLPLIRSALGADVESTAVESRAVESGAVESGGGLSRRGLLRTTWLASGVAVLATAGSTVPLLRKVSVLGVRSGDGPGGVPINKSAAAARVTAAATSPAYRLTVAYGDRERTLTRDELAALPQRTHGLPIACVEGWSAQGEWTGVRLRDLLDLVGAPTGHDVGVESLQESGPYRRTTLPANFADDDRTLLALRLAGEALAIDHGYPARLIAPDRPGVLQTKWVQRLEVLHVSRPQPGRLVVGGVGVLVGAYGGYLLLTRQGGEDHVATATWLAAGVVLHDVVLAPLVLLVSAVVVRVLPRPARVPATVGLVVLGAVTLLGIPVLGRFGAHADNPTLLDRPYAAGWAVLAGLVLVAVVVASVVRARHGGERATRRPPA